MNPKLLSKLQTMEPELRTLIGDGQDASITISFDGNGTSFSLVKNDGTGGSESFHKRIPIKKG